ncbi:hypothetical protein JKF63_07353 [Porcisia hertigi]|uniref:Uncharacterized protein n=1 Tax=Porcisia hertigi TaxID=2761500 RepID=A0A836LKR5_9TRYP|nr:hypothetical protein JKF63_07353 [Porcisia hertigi]
MPRAYCKPFTAYEEAFGFHATRRIAYMMCSVFFGGLLLKCMLLLKYSTVANSNWTSPLEDDPRYQELMEKRLTLAEDLSQMNKHPRDICTAVFEGDITRVQQLVTAAGVYGGRWHSPFSVNTSAAARDALARWEDVGDGEAGDQGDEESDMEDLLGEEAMEKLMAHPALVSVMKDFALDAEAGGEGTDQEGGVGSYRPDDDDAALLDEEAAEAAEADREAQQRDISLYKRLLAHQLHRDSVADHLQRHGLLRMSTTPPVDMTLYGILFSCREAPAALSAGAGGDAAEASESVVPLQVRWQPSKRSRFAGTPLHWAVLARAHDMVRFLVEHGVDSTAGLKAVTVDGTALDPHPAFGDAKVLAALTPALMAAANESHTTFDVLERAVAAHKATRADEEAFFVVLEERLRSRKEAYLSRREDLRLQRLLAAEGLAEEFEEGEEDHANNNDDDDDGASGGDGDGDGNDDDDDSGGDYEDANEGEEADR